MKSWPDEEQKKRNIELACCLSVTERGMIVMDMVIFRTIFFELLVFFTFTLLTLHFVY